MNHQENLWLYGRFFVTFLANSQTPVNSLSLSQSFDVIDRLLSEFMEAKS